VGGAIIRTEKARSPRAYLDSGGRAGQRRPVPARELPFEYMLNALRLHEGFTHAHFTAATGLAASAVQPVLARLSGRGLIGEAGGSWRPTEVGFRFLNELQAEFLPEGKLGPAQGELCTAGSRLAPVRDFQRIVRKVP
jgi:oxygen-independent coproporphyrinogen-3 oxidase